MKKISLFVLLCCSLGMWAQKIENQYCYFDNSYGIYKNYSENLPAADRFHMLYIANPDHTVPMFDVQDQLAEMIKNHNTLGIVYSHAASIIVDVFTGENPDRLKQIERDYLEPIRKLVEKGCVKSTDLEDGGRGLNSVSDEFWLFPDCKLEDVFITSATRPGFFGGWPNVWITDYKVDIAKSPASLIVYKGNALQIRIRTYRYYDPEAGKSVFVAFNQYGIDRDYKLTEAQKQDVALIWSFYEESLKNEPQYKELIRWLEYSTWKDLEPNFRQYFHLKYPERPSDDTNYRSVTTPPCSTCPKAFTYPEKSTPPADSTSSEGPTTSGGATRPAGATTSGDATRPSSPTTSGGAANPGGSTNSGRSTVPTTFTRPSKSTPPDPTPDPTPDPDPEPTPEPDICKDCVKDGCTDCKKCGECEACRNKCKRTADNPDKPEIPIEVVYVEPGTFVMGCHSDKEANCIYNEKPAHEVTLDGFYIMATEVTQELWQKVMGTNPSAYKNGGNYPVEKISWNDCQAFVKKLNELTGKHYDIPTEAQWEYAARGGHLAADNGDYIYAGDDEIDSVAWYNDGTEHFTMPVGSKKPNALGLYDMSGNVMEWCKDRMGNYTADAQTNPQGPADGTNCVLRGGSWKDEKEKCRVSYRYSSNPTYKMNTFGLRLVLIP